MSVVIVFFLSLAGCSPGTSDAKDDTGGGDSGEQAAGLEGSTAFEPDSVIAAAHGERLYVLAAAPAITCADLVEIDQTGSVPPGRGFWLVGDSVSGCDASTECVAGPLTDVTGEVWELTEDGDPFEGDGALFYGDGSASVTMSGDHLLVELSLTCFDTYCPDLDPLTGSLLAENCGQLP